MGLSRQEVADRLIALGNALASGSEIELSAGGDTLKLGVASHVDWELELEIDGDETELEMEISGPTTRRVTPSGTPHRATATRHPTRPILHRPPIPHRPPRNPARRAADVPARSPQPDRTIRAPPAASV